jgi:hypothetical protein
MNPLNAKVARRAKTPKAAAQESLAVELPRNVFLRSTDDRAAFVRLFQQQLAIYQPNSEVERSYVGYIAMALFRYHQLLAIEYRLFQFFPKGTGINFENLPNEARELFRLESDHDFQRFLQTLDRDQRAQQTYHDQWVRTLRLVQRHFPVTRSLAKNYA